MISQNIGFCYNSCTFGRIGTEIGWRVNVNKEYTSVLCEGHLVKDQGQDLLKIRFWL